MILDFVFSLEGMRFLKDFRSMFDSAFRIDEPSGKALILDDGIHSYLIPDDEKLEEFKNAVQSSVKTGKNVLAERYKNNAIKYEDNVLY